MTDPARILLFQEDRSSTDSLRSRLANEGFDVTCARTFLEAVPFLATGRTDLFLFYLPEKDWVRNTILTEVHRANPTLRIVAMAPTVSDELFQLLARFHVSTVLPARGNWRDAVEKIRGALTSNAGENVASIEPQDIRTTREDQR